MPYATLPALFISHGSPMTAVDTSAFGEALHRVATNLPEPNAIVVLSAHWQSDTLEVTTAQHPETWHDYHGFPEALKRIRYPAPGSPALAERILHLLEQTGIEAYGNALRPRDHGVWVPLRHLYPDANIPVIQLSLPINYTAAQLMRLGQALILLRTQQILLIGSGSITHNLKSLSWGTKDAPPPLWASQFKQWMIHHLTVGDYDSVCQWQTQAPYANDNHPTTEHLAPLFFAMGTGTRCNVVHSSFAMGALGMDIYRFD